jgi:hypothetical protein
MVVVQMNDQQNDISNNKKIIGEQRELLAAQQKTIDELGLKLIDNQINMIDMEIKVEQQMKLSSNEIKLLKQQKALLIGAIIFIVGMKMLF